MKKTFDYSDTIEQLRKLIDDNRFVCYRILKDYDIFRYYCPKPGIEDFFKSKKEDYEWYQHRHYHFCDYIGTEIIKETEKTGKIVQFTLVMSHLKDKETMNFDVKLGKYYPEFYEDDDLNKRMGYLARTISSGINYKGDVDTDYLRKFLFHYDRVMKRAKELNAL